MQTLLLALALIFILEGMLYAFAPQRVKDFANTIATLPADFLRRIGLIAVLLGCALAWLAGKFLF